MATADEIKSFLHNLRTDPQDSIFVAFPHSVRLNQAAARVFETLAAPPSDEEYLEFRKNFESAYDSLDSAMLHEQKSKLSASVLSEAVEIALEMYSTSRLRSLKL